MLVLNGKHRSSSIFIDVFISIVATSKQFLADRLFPQITSISSPAASEYYFTEAVANARLRRRLD